MSGTARFSLALRYTPPGGPQVTPTFVVDVVHAAMSSGILDIPATTADATAIVVPFGEVDAAKGFLIRNRSAQQIGVRFNGAVADEFSIAAGACLMMSMADASDDTPLTAISVVTTAEQLADGEVDYFVFGDDPTPEA